MWGAPTWRAGYDGIQHPGLCLRFDERLPKTGTLRVRVKETKDIANAATVKFCTVEVGGVEQRADVVPGPSEVKWNAKLDFTLHGEEDFVNVAVVSEDGGRTSSYTSIIPITEILAAIHPTMPVAPSEDHKEKYLTPLQTDCKSIHTALQHTTALPDHLKEAITELIAGAYIDPPRHDAWFSLYDDKFVLMGLLNLCFYFTPSHYPAKAPKAPVLSAKKPAAKSWFSRKAPATETPAAPKVDKYYGVSVEEATAQSGGALPVPLTVLTEYLTAEGLLVEGIFRVPGSKDKIDAIIEAFKQDAQPTLTDVHDAAGALKAFFRMMPEPVIPFSHYDGFIGIAADPERSIEEKKSLFSSMVQNLPAPNIAVVKHLMAFLNKIVAYSEVNLMTAENLAIVFAPNLLKPEATSIEEESKLLMSDAGPAHLAIEMIIKYAQEILPADPVVLETSVAAGTPSEKIPILTVRRSSMDRRTSVSSNPVNELAKAILDLEAAREEASIARSKQEAAEAEKAEIESKVDGERAQLSGELEKAKAELEQLKADLEKERKEALDAKANADEAHAADIKKKEAQYQKLLQDNTSLMVEMSTQARETASVVSKLKAQHEEYSTQLEQQMARLQQEAKDDRENMTRDYTKATEQQKAELTRLQQSTHEEKEKLQQRMAELSAEHEALKAEHAVEKKRSRTETEQLRETLNNFTIKSVEEKNAIMEQLLAQQQLRAQAQLERSNAIMSKREVEDVKEGPRCGPEMEAAILDAMRGFIEEQTEIVWYAGKLMKRTTSFPKRWQPRECTLTSRKLLWITPRNNSAKTVLGCIELSEMRSVSSVSGGSGFLIYVHSKGGIDGVFEFQGANTSTRDMWVNQLNSAIAKANRGKVATESLEVLLHRVIEEQNNIVMHV